MWALTKWLGKVTNNMAFFPNSSPQENQEYRLGMLVPLVLDECLKIRTQYLPHIQGRC